MPTQEDRAINRIKTVSAMIRDKKRIGFKELDSWALVHMGISEKTLNRYLAALVCLGLVKTDSGDLIWNGETK